jgi:hypothetical protein
LPPILIFLHRNQRHPSEARDALHCFIFPECGKHVLALSFSGFDPEADILRVR